MDKTRLQKIEEGFEEAFGSSVGSDGPVSIISAPGRVEILGNHTDHQLGMTISCAIGLDTLGAARRNSLNQIRLYSEGYNPSMVHLSDLGRDRASKGTSRALIRGVADGFSKRGYKIGGFDAWLASDVPKGSGLSSSASFEAWVASAFSQLYCDGGINPVDIAKICSYAENVHFGKPSGMQDQMASALGGILFLDFSDPEDPSYQRIENTLQGYSLCIIESGAEHSGLTDHYSAITRDLGQIAAFFGKDVMGHVGQAEFMESMPALREKFGDRATLRAMHIYSENRRALKAKAALESGDMDLFFQMVKDSGKSSFAYLQNVIVPGETRHQDLAVAVSLAEELLEGRGACRIQGGGFAGAAEAFVPDDILPEFTDGVDKVFGQGSCRALSIRLSGAGLAEGQSS